MNSALLSNQVVRIMSPVEELALKVLRDSYGVCQKTGLGLVRSPFSRSICILEWLKADFSPGPGVLCCQTTELRCTQLLAGQLVDLRGS